MIGGGAPSGFRFGFGNTIRTDRPPHLRLQAPAPLQKRALFEIAEMSRSGNHGTRNRRTRGGPEEREDEEEDGHGQHEQHGGPEPSPDLSDFQLHGNSYSYSSRGLQVPVPVTATDQEQRFACKHCGQTFSKKRSLRNHEQSHIATKNKQFVCHVCDAVFGRVYELRRHMVTHHAHAGVQGEDRQFADEDEEEVIEEGQQQQQQGAYAYPRVTCDVCGASFARRDGLLRHQRRCPAAANANASPMTRSVSPATPVPVSPQTQTQTQTQTQPASASSTATASNTFACTGCGTTYSRRDALVRHQKRSKGPACRTTAIPPPGTAAGSTARVNVKKASAARAETRQMELDAAMMMGSTIDMGSIAAHGQQGFQQLQPSFVGIPMPYDYSQTLQQQHHYGVQQSMDVNTAGQQQQQMMYSSFPPQQAAAGYHGQLHSQSSLNGHGYLQQQQDFGIASPSSGGGANGGYEGRWPLDLLANITPALPSLSSASPSIDHAPLTQQQQLATTTDFDSSRLEVTKHALSDVYPRFPPDLLPPFSMVDAIIDHHIRFHSVVILHIPTLKADVQSGKAEIGVLACLIWGTLGMLQGEGPGEGSWTWSRLRSEEYRENLEKWCLEWIFNECDRALASEPADIERITSLARAMVFARINSNGAELLLQRFQEILLMVFTRLKFGHVSDDAQPRAPDLASWIRAEERVRLCAQLIISDLAVAEGNGRTPVIIPTRTNGVRFDQLTGRYEREWANLPCPCPDVFFEGLPPADTSGYPDLEPPSWGSLGMLFNWMDLPLTDPMRMAVLNLAVGNILERGFCAAHVFATAFWARVRDLRSVCTERGQPLCQPWDQDIVDERARLVAGLEDVWRYLPATVQVGHEIGDGFGLRKVGVDWWGVLRGGRL